MHHATYMQRWAGRRGGSGKGGCSGDKEGAERGQRMIVRSGSSSYLIQQADYLGVHHATYMQRWVGRRGGRGTVEAGKVAESGQRVSSEWAESG